MTMPAIPRPPLALSLAGVRLEGAAQDVGAEGLRSALALAGSVGCRGIVLSATASGLRPRDLDRSARRDLASLLRRSELPLVGLDLWIPPEHFGDPVHADRALAAVGAALELCAEVAPLSGSGDRGVVSLTLPRPVTTELRTAMAAAADRTGAVIADHAWPWVEAIDAERGLMGVGLDPGTVLAAGGVPDVEASQLGRRLAIARLSDLLGGRRVSAGDGALKSLEYSIGLQASGYLRPVVIDVRGLAESVRSVRRMAASWKS